MSASFQPRIGFVLSLSAVLGLSLLPTASYAAALPIIKDEWSLSATEAGAVFAAYQAGYVAATLLLLPLTDRWDARRMVVLMAALSAAANALFPLLAVDFWSGALLRFIAGAALVGIYMPGTRIVAERYPPERRGGPIGLYVASFYMDTNLSMLLTGLLLPALDWRGAYLGCAALAGLSLPLAWVVLRGGTLPEPVEGRGRGRLDPTVLTNRPAALAMAGYAAHTWELYAARGWIAPFLATVLAAQGLGLADAAAFGATISGAAFGIGALSVLGAGFISDRFGRTLTAGTFLLGSALCSLAIGWLGGWPWWGLFLIALVYGFFIGGDSPVYTTAVTELSRPGQLGSTMAVQSFVGFLASIAGPIAFGAVLDAGLGWGIGFMVAGGGALLGVIALVVLRRDPASAALAGGRR